MDRGQIPLELNKAGLTCSGGPAVHGLAYMSNITERANELA
jgi:hypothetical protein